ncbi:MAG: hypothetical protein CMN30_28020 [Sandaracinus sp.]|nr:hypothetical protein [Sandaracinus sp.]
MHGRPVGRSIPFWFCLAAVAGCGSCDESLQVDGDHPHLRCVAGEAEPFEHGLGAGSATLDDDGVLTLEGLEPRLLAFSLSPGADLDTLPEAPLRVVLGGFARDEASAARLLGGLAAAGPTLLLPGGEDSSEVLDEALEAVDAEALIDLRGVRLVRFGGHEWVVVPGAPDGRYARGDDACGFVAADLEKLELADATGPRHLLAWAAPLGAGPVSRGLGDLEVGDASLGTLVERSGILGGLVAWPRQPRPVNHPVGESSWVGVPAWGRVIEGPDGRWSRGGAALVNLADGPGLTLAPAAAPAP